MTLATLISYYGPKPPGFAQLIGECQAQVGAVLGDDFQPYDIRQVHCTIASLDRVGDLGLVNNSFHEFRGQRVEMDLAGLLGYLRAAFADAHIQIGGYSEAVIPFTSRGQSPYHRSFSLQDGKAVIMGWPIHVAGAVPSYPQRLESLRRELQRFGILHRYHRTPADVDNDFYLRIGLYDRTRVAPSAKLEVETRLREFLSKQPPLIIPLRASDVAFAVSGHETLPPELTKLMRVSDPGATVQSIAQLFGWSDIA